MSTGTIVLIVVVALVVLIGAYIGATYNKLVKSKNSVEEAFSTMDVYLKKRWDLIPNIVVSVKGYAKHEAETLEKVISARNNGYSSMNSQQKLEANAELNTAIKSLNVVAEQYPELKANQNFMDLNAQLKKTEEDISNARKFYNAVVKQYNNTVEMFPSSIVASMFHFEKRDMFAVEDSAQREAVKVEF